MGDPTRRDAVLSAVQSVDPSLGLMGGTVNETALPAYARYQFLAPLLRDPQKLMQFIDQEHQRNSGRSSGSQSDLWAAQRANEALSAIYGINDYNPKGFLKYTTDPATVQKLGGGEAYSPTGGWVDPRPFTQVK